MRYLILTLTLLFSMFLDGASAQQSKRVLYVRIDTVKISTSPADVIVPVRYRLETDSAHLFTSYLASVIYGPAVFGKAFDILTAGTASRFVDNVIKNVSWNDKAVFIAQSSVMLDTSNRTLFNLRFTAKKEMKPSDRIEILWDDLQLPDDLVDSVVYTNGWILYEEKSIEPPLPDTVRLTFTGVTDRSDSLVSVPVGFNSMVGADVKRFALGFDYDTSVMRFERAKVHNTAQPFSVISQKQGMHVDVFVESVDTNRIPGGDTLLMLEFTLLPREDTVCTSLMAIGLQALNPEAGVELVEIEKLEPICVQGTGPKASVFQQQIESRWVCPNPSRGKFTFRAEGSQFSLTVRDLQGRVHYETTGFGQAVWDASSAVARGTYYATLREASGTNAPENIRVFKLQLR